MTTKHSKSKPLLNKQLRVEEKVGLVLTNKKSNKEN